MEKVIYTVIRLDGDYAVMVSEEGVENTVARALLPMEIEEGTKLLCEMFMYTIIE
ncbi:MAG: chorismate--pyruvate lyase [Oscillospiraceae bacterium]|nr:chorismate--pyruvate lyase [Oscillospiraceae bacterium]